ncbi:MAG TPA: diguanylate cyclase [Thermoanaerobaculia bacterium]|jgi:diguanylate cyclase (GGDEF)-like protein
MNAPQIVLVEDDPHVSLMLRRHLERAGYAVRAGATIAAARELVHAGAWDLAILDRNLPDGNGFDFCRALRGEFPHAYLIMLTGESSAEAKLEGFRHGADDYITKPFEVEELLARIRAGARICALQKALLASNRRLEELSLTDALTSLRNRRAFDEELAVMYGHSLRYDRPLSLAMIDVDFFKDINDTSGHGAGDAVLRSVAQLIATCTRQSDFAARIGGEEFAVLLPETPLFEAMQFGEKIRSAVASATIRTGEVAHRVTVSVGVANMPHSRIVSAESLVEAADLALYRAKENGRNRVEVERRSASRSATPPESVPTLRTRDSRP